MLSEPGFLFKPAEFKFCINQKIEFCLTIQTPMSDFFNHSISGLFGTSFQRALEGSSDEELSRHDDESLNWLYLQAAYTLHRGGAELVNGVDEFLVYGLAALEDHYIAKPSAYFEKLDSWFDSRHPASMRFGFEFVTLTSFIRSLLNKLGQEVCVIESIARRVFSTLASLYQSGQRRPVSLDPAFCSEYFAPFSRDEMKEIFSNESLHELLKKDSKYEKTYADILEKWRIESERF